jgi:hypothetical protein
MLPNHNQSSSGRVPFFIFSYCFGQQITYFNFTLTPNYPEKKSPTPKSEASAKKRPIQPGAEPVPTSN